MQYVLFTDDLSDLSLEQALKSAKEAGFDGIELTLRGGGHVLPENAEKGLAAAQQAADALGMTIPLAATSIDSVNSPHAESVFASAAHHGVRMLRLAYWGYKPFGSLEAQIEKTQERLRGIVELGKKFHVLPCVHVHCGRLISNSGPLLYLLLKPFKPDEVGAIIDPMHMTLEGGLNGWEMGLDLIHPWIAALAIKNFKWVETERDKRGQLKYRWHFTPLADGQAPLPEFFDYMKQLKFDGVVSLHSEYKGANSFRSLSTKELLEQSTVDLKYVKQLLQPA